LIRKVYAEKMCIRMLVLFNLLDASGDVLTPFFPPQAKLESSDPFALKHLERTCLSVVQDLYLAMHARGNVPDILRGKVRVLSFRLDAVDDAFLIQLRTLFNDGRSAARALFYRFIGFFFMHESPKVTIRLVHPAEPVPDVESAEGSPFFDFETTLVATVNGVVDAIVTPPSRHPPHMGLPAALLPPQTIMRGIGTDSSFTTGDGGHYPHVAGEKNVKQRTCIYRFSRRLAKKIIKVKVTVEPKVFFAIAMCVRSIISGRRIAWTTPDGSHWKSTDATGPGHWWLLVPKPTARNTVTRKIQALTREEHHALHMSVGINGAPAGLLDLELDGEDEENVVDDVGEGGDQNLELDD
ncbi:hypothetical protein BU14_0711s0001, partial [Porphyra umbilicalis]